MPRIWAVVLSVLVNVGAATAQGLAEGLALAQDEADAQHWDAALRVLLGAQKAATSDVEREQLAQKLAEIGWNLEAASQFEPALHAREAALSLFQSIHGDLDHADVAAGLSNVARSLGLLGRAGEALPRDEITLSMMRRLHGDVDHADLAISLSNLASCLDSLGRSDEALPRHEEALAMTMRLYDERDHSHIALAQGNLAGCLARLGRPNEALPHYEAALGMLRRLYPDEDRPDVAFGLNNVGSCLLLVGRADEALQHNEAALAMRKRLYVDRDHPDLAVSLHCVANCLDSLGRAGEALPQHEAAMAMEERLFAGRDHPAIAGSHLLVGQCLISLARVGKALPQFEAALAMNRRMYGDRDHPDTAQSLNNMAHCLWVLGRANEALPLHEESLQMRRRLCDGRDNSALAMSLNNVAVCLKTLGRNSEALPVLEAEVAMNKRLYGDRDHPDLMLSIGNLGVCLGLLGRHGEALQQFEMAMAMGTRLYGSRVHPRVARNLGNVAGCLYALGREGEALPQFEAALAMRKRVYGDRDHPDLVSSFHNLANCLQSLGHADESLPFREQAVAMIERLRNDSRVSAELRQSFFDDLKGDGAFESLQALTVQLGKTADSWLAAERGRGRELLDLLEQQQFDAIEVGVTRARQRGDDATATRLPELRRALDATEIESDRLVHLLSKIEENPAADADDLARRGELLAQSNEVSRRRRQLLDERARLLGDVLPVGRVRTAPEVQAVLAKGEILLEFTVAKNASFLYVLTHDGGVEVLPLPNAVAAADRLLADVLSSGSHSGLAEQRGRDADARPVGSAAIDPSRELFQSLIPADLWPRLQAARRVFVAAHRALHRLPFELLVTDLKDGKPVYWIENGPPIAYVPSGSVLHWLRKRASEDHAEATTLDLLAIGDPSLGNSGAEMPEHGVLVRQVTAGGEAARAGIQPLDVLVSYDGKPLADDQDLRDLRTQIEAATQQGTRPASSIAVDVWREGATRRVEVNPGLLGIQVGVGAARGAFEASLAGAAEVGHLVRKDDLGRLARLPQLKGARAEATAIVAAFRAKERQTDLLLGEKATEPAVFDLAAKAKYVHFACHGIAEECLGQSLSMLVLAQPMDLLPDEDGFLKLGDLLHGWRGRLHSCRLVVLSACRTSVGPTLRDEAPQALPIGFLFAGAPSVISSLWAVDDDSTRVLMTDFYQRLLAGETDRLKAFTDAKKALRQKYPDPFYWAPLLYIGCPE